MIYRARVPGGFGLVALAGLALLANLFLMYTSAEPDRLRAAGAAGCRGGGTLSR